MTSVSASYERSVPAKLFVHIEGEAPFEASPADLANFGYVKIEREEPKTEGESTGFTVDGLLSTGAKVGKTAVDVATTVGKVGVAVVRERIKENKKNQNK